jgi:hypothetical protein
MGTNILNKPIAFNSMPLEVEATGFSGTLVSINLTT